MGARLGAYVHPNSVATAAHYAGIVGANKSQTIRYGILVHLLGTDPREALEKVLGRKSLADLDDVSGPVVAIIPEDELEEALAKAHERMPNAEKSFLVRYVLARMEGATEKQAEAIAKIQRGRPPKNQAA